MLLNRLSRASRASAAPVDPAPAPVPTPAPKPAPAPEKARKSYLELVKAAPRKRTLRTPEPWYQANHFLRYFLKNKAADVLHLADDVVDAWQEWCALESIKPCNRTAFLSELRAPRFERYCKISRPWKIDPEGNPDHEWLLSSMVRRNKFVDRPMVYAFAIPPEEKHLFEDDDAATDGQPTGIDSQADHEWPSVDAGPAVADSQPKVNRGKPLSNQRVA